ncbi:MAG: tetratricopeptide repeat protein [Acidobacteriota bacterium]
MANQDEIRRESPPEPATELQPKLSDVQISRRRPAQSEEGDLNWVLVPVSATDHARRKRRFVMMLGILALAVLLITGYIYKRSVDPIRGLEAFDVGERLLKTARYQQAIVSFDRAISLRPGFADAHLLRSKAYVALAKPALAMADLNIVIGLRPDDPQPYLDRARVHISQQELAEAIADCDRAAALDVKLDRAYNLRGVAVRTMGQPRKSLEDFTRAVELRPDMDNLYQRGSTYQELGEHEFAIADFSRVISFSPTSSQAYFARAKSYRAIGDNASAERDHSTARMLDSH